MVSKTLREPPNCRLSMRFSSNTTFKLQRISNTMPKYSLRSTNVEHNGHLKNDVTIRFSHQNENFALFSAANFHKKYLDQFTIYQNILVPSNRPQFYSMGANWESSTLILCVLFVAVQLVNSICFSVFVLDYLLNSYIL